MAPSLEAPSASAATPPTSTSAGPPVSSALRSVGHRSGSTATTRVPGATASVMPAMSPPPPTATRIVSAPPVCSSSSRPSVPCPATTSAWS